MSAVISAGSTVSYETFPSFSFFRKNAYSPWFGFTSMPRCGRSGPPDGALELAGAASSDVTAGAWVARRRECNERAQTERAARDAATGAESILG